MNRESSSPLPPLKFKSTPREDDTLVLLTSRATPRTLDMDAINTQKYETLRRENAFTQEVQQTVVNIIKNALAVGQVHARVQTLRIDYQYSYIFSADHGGDQVFQVHDTHTHLPLEAIRTRIHFYAPAKELIEWLRTHIGIQVICTGRTMPGIGEKGGERVLCGYVHLEALFVPIKPATSSITSGGGGGAHPHHELMNSVYTHKALDSSAISEWNKRCLYALKVGASHFILFVLFHYADFRAGYALEPSGGSARHYFTMQPFETDPEWALDGRFNVVAAWTARLGYQWILTSDSNDAENGWAYFTVLLDPISSLK